MRSNDTARRAPATIEEQRIIRDLARFRYSLRRFLRFSEKAARRCGLTPQQHQLLLGIAGFAEDGAATISELAEFLQERNNSVVGLVERAAEAGLVRRRNAALDRRQVVVTMTVRGARILAKLSRLHHDEVRRMRAGFGPDGVASPSVQHSKRTAAQ